MNLDQWKKQPDNLQCLGQRVGQLAPGTVYGALCSALLPVADSRTAGRFRGPGGAGQRGRRRGAAT